jgi:hypothetical protein
MTHDPRVQAATRRALSAVFGRLQRGDDDNADADAVLLSLSEQGLSVVPTARMQALEVALHPFAEFLDALDVHGGYEPPDGWIVRMDIDPPVTLPFSALVEARRALSATPEEPTAAPPNPDCAAKHCDEPATVGMTWWVGPVRVEIDLCEEHFDAADAPVEPPFGAGRRGGVARWPEVRVMVADFRVGPRLDPRAREEPSP